MNIWVWLLETYESARKKISLETGLWSPQKYHTHNTHIQPYITKITRIAIIIVNVSIGHLWMHSFGKVKKNKSLNYFEV